MDIFDVFLQIDFSQKEFLTTRISTFVESRTLKSWWGLFMFLQEMPYIQSLIIEFHTTLYTFQIFGPQLGGWTRMNPQIVRIPTKESKNGY